MAEANPFQVLAQALPEQRNFFRQDPVLQTLLARVLPTRTLSWAVLQLELMGGNAATRIDRLARQANRNVPQHRPYDALGNRVDEIEYHPSWHEMERMAYGAGIIALKHESELRQAHAQSLNVLALSISYLFAQSEIGLFRAASHTDAAYRLVERYGTAEQRARFLAALASRDADRLFRGGIFLAERQAGSDLGAIATRAVRSGNSWLLHGEKWFCSNADADLILTVARPEGGPAGFEGLRVFAIHRDRLGDARDAIRINRVKDKLGVRSLATGEVELRGAIGEPLGSERQAEEVLRELHRVSRLYTSFAGAAIMRRASFEATQYVRARRTFGMAAIEHPLVRESLADLNAEEIAAKHLVFWAARHFDDADQGVEGAAELVRILVPLAKVLTSVRAAWSASEALQLHGGNGYVEDFVTGRLVRDAQVLPVWDGTNNLITLEILRGCFDEGWHRPLLAEVRRRCERATQDEETALVLSLTQELEDELASFAGREVPPGLARPLVERLAMLYPLALLAEESTTSSVAAPLARAALERLLQRHSPTIAPSGAELDMLINGPVLVGDSTAVP